MRELSMTVTLVTALALAGCSDGCRRKGRARTRRPARREGREGRHRGSRDGAQGRVAAVIDCLMQWRRDYDQRLLQRHLQFLPACPAGKQRALRQQSEFDNAARDDRVRKTLVGLVRARQLAALVMACAVIPIAPLADP